MPEDADEVTSSEPPSQTKENRRPLRSSLRSARSDADEARGDLRRKDSRVSIGHVQIEELVIPPAEKDHGGSTSLCQISRPQDDVYDPLLELTRKTIVVKLMRKPDVTTPYVMHEPFGWTCVRGDGPITIAEFTDLVTAAVESFQEQQRQEWQRARSSVRTSFLQEPQTLAREGSFRIVSVAPAGGEEVDSTDDTQIDVPDGGVIVCHADVNQYVASGGLCVACCVLQ